MTAHGALCHEQSSFLLPWSAPHTSPYFSSHQADWQLLPYLLSALTTLGRQHILLTKSPYLPHLPVLLYLFFNSIQQTYIGLDNSSAQGHREMKIRLLLHFLNNYHQEPRVISAVLLWVASSGKKTIMTAPGLKIKNYPQDVLQNLAQTLKYLLSK